MKNVQRLRMCLIVATLAFSPDLKMLASGSQDETVRLIDARTGVLKQTLAGHGGPVLSIAFSPDGNVLASAGGKTVRLWDLGEGAGIAS